ncbi:class I tRNA ligase family protein, partial [Staphylococcus epidermidis]|uniref:class I tRNA ligase family protein n=1 Tax=Staphylococcus epidermidis TaxID=1282 RepID=UPI00119F393B
KIFNQHFPPHFIPQALDQTTPSFYTLLLISTILKPKSSYKPPLSLPHILHTNAKKISKTKPNLINPTQLINNYAPDSLRSPLISHSA